MRCGRGRRGGVTPPLVVDQLGEPAHLALDGLQAVPLQLEGVAVEPLAGARERGAEAVDALLEPRPAALEDAQPGGGVGAPEEGEVDAEPLVLPGRGPALGEQVLEVLLALGRELVDDARRACPRRPAASRSAGVLGDRARAQQLLEAGVERAVGERPEGPEQRVEPLAQLVAVQRALLQQAEDGQLEDPGALGHVPSPYPSDVSSRYIATIGRRRPVGAAKSGARRERPRPGTPAVRSTA